MFWNEVDFSLIQKEQGRNGRQTFRYDGKPFRFQIPDGVVEWGLSEYNSLTIDIPDMEFHDWFHSLEDYIGKPEPFSTILKERLRIKLDDFSMVFDSDRNLDISERVQGAFQGCKVKCIIEILGMYYFNDTYGLTCKMYQMLYEKSETSGCLFTLPQTAS